MGLESDRAGVLAKRGRDTRHLSLLNLSSLCTLSLSIFPSLSTSTQRKCPIKVHLQWEGAIYKLGICLNHEHGLLISRTVKNKCECLCLPVCSVWWGSLSGLRHTASAWNSPGHRSSIRSTLWQALLSKCTTCGIQGTRILLENLRRKTCILKKRERTPPPSPTKEKKKSNVSIFTDF